MGSQDSGTSGQKREEPLITSGQKREEPLTVEEGDGSLTSGQKREDPLTSGQKREEAE